MATSRATDVDPPPWDHLTGTERYTACLTAARAGDRRALAALVADLTPVIWHVARGNGLSRAVAEDVVQTVWLSLLNHLAALSEPGALVSWLITTTRREAARAGGHEDTEDHTDRFWRAFTQLPQRCQELLRLTVMAGRADYGVVAEALRMPRGGIGPSRSRCLTMLGELLAADDTFPVTIYLADESIHEQVETAVHGLVQTFGADIVDRDDPVLGSWFRHMWAKEAAASAAHALDSRLVLAQDATVTSTMMQNLGPVLTALQPTKDAVIRIGALLIVKVDGTVAVHQLTATQQLQLDHQPQLLTSPQEILLTLTSNGQRELGP